MKNNINFTFKKMDDGVVFRNFIGNKREKENGITDNLKIVKNFLKKYDLSDKAILQLEVYGQISDGEFEDCNEFEMDWSDCISELEDYFYYPYDLSDDILKDWDEVRQNLNYDLVYNDKFSRDDRKPFIRKGFVASILPLSIKDDTLSIIEKHLHIL